MAGPALNQRLPLENSAEQALLLYSVRSIAHQRHNLRLVIPQHIPNAACRGHCPCGGYGYGSKAVMDWGTLTCFE